MKKLLILKITTNLGYIISIINGLYLVSKLLDYKTKIKRIVSLVMVRSISKAILVFDKYILLYFYISGYLNWKLIIACLVREIYTIDNL